MNREPSIFLHAFTFHCFIVFWLSHRHHSPPMTHRDSLYFVIFDPPFLPYPVLSLSLSHSSAIPAVRKSPHSRSEDTDTVRYSAYCAHKHTHTHFILCPPCKNVNMIRTQVKKCAQLISRHEKDTTRCRIRSSEWRSVKW